MPDDKEGNNAVKIAVLDEQIKGLREQASAHNSSTISRLNHIEEKLDDLTAIMNRGKGAYAASLAIAGSIGAAVITALGYIYDHLHR